MKTLKITFLLIIINCIFIQSIKVSSFYNDYLSSNDFYDINNNTSNEKSNMLEGSIKLDSGLEYKILSSGTGKSPQSFNEVEVNYQGNLLTGEEFDSSYKRGTSTSFRVNQVIKGWQQALQLMKEGDKWEILIPSNLAYGENGIKGVIPPNAPLKFIVELLKVKN